MNYSISETTESQPIDYNTNPTSVTTPTSNIDGGLMDSCWPMKSQNRRHTGLSPYRTPDSRGSVNWTYKTGGYIEGGIVIDDEGVLYFGDFGYYLRAVYPDGSTKWRFKTNGWIWSTPALASDGTVYVGTYGNFLYAINPNGTLKWKYAAKASISSSPAIAKDGTVYIGSSSDDTSSYWGLLYAFCSGDLNNKPNKPSIDGTTYGKLGESYTYVFNGSDPDGDLISYFVEWGDGVNTGWVGPYESGESIELSHTWTFQPTSYSIRVKIKDEHGVESDFTYLKVFMLKNRLNHGIWILFDWLKEFFDIDFFYQI
jgi:hypothetical protein